LGDAKALPMGSEQAGAPTGIQRFHAARRSPPTFLGVLALIVLFVALMFVPAVASLVTIHRSTAVTVGVAWLVCAVAATTAYHLTGLSRLYFALDTVESLSLQAGVCLLVYRSGSAVSIFWLAYLGHAQVIAALGFVAQNLVVIAAGPTALVLLFWLKGAPASALLSLLVGSMGAWLYSVMARLHSSREASRVREVQRENSLARLCIGEERNRIARDLHDGVAGELAALAWRLRQIPLGAEATTLPASEAEVNHLEGRIRSVLKNLRHVVLDLREERRSWVDTVVALRERCHDLCGSRQLVFDVSGAQDGPLMEGLADDVQCIVSELVRNAAVHADPRRVEVRIRILDRVEVSVSDDGTGLPSDHGSRSSGGLANLRSRVLRLGGSVDIQSTNPGTRVEVRLPPLTQREGRVASTQSIPSSVRLP
jgi:signal transduction histidine kinase